MVHVHTPTVTSGTISKSNFSSSAPIHTAVDTRLCTSYMHSFSLCIPYICVSFSLFLWPPITQYSVIISYGDPVQTSYIYIYIYTSDTSQMFFFFFVYYIVLWQRLYDDKTNLYIRLLLRKITNTSNQLISFGIFSGLIHYIYIHAPIGYYLLI